MNKVIKFHKPQSPAFNSGEVWISANGAKVTIDSVAPWPKASDKWAFSVSYTQSDGSKATKDVWAFQVRYNHQADLLAANRYEAADEGNTPD